MSRRKRQTGTEFWWTGCVWPRGVSKEAADIDCWLKEVAPSNELRKWFAHDPDKWQEFRKKYMVELRNQREAVGRIRHLEEQHGTVTLLFAAKDAAHNNAVVLRNFLQR